MGGVEESGDFNTVDEAKIEEIVLSSWGVPANDNSFAKLEDRACNAVNPVGVLRVLCDSHVDRRVAVRVVRFLQKIPIEGEGVFFNQDDFVYLGCGRLPQNHGFLNWFEIANYAARVTVFNAVLWYCYGEENETMEEEPVRSVPAGKSADVISFQPHLDTRKQVNAVLEDVRGAGKLIQPAVWHPAVRAVSAKPFRSSDEKKLGDLIQLPLVERAAMADGAEPVVEPDGEQAASLYEITDPLRQNLNAEKISGYLPEFSNLDSLLNICTRFIELFGERWFKLAEVLRFKGMEPKDALKLANFLQKSADKVSSPIDYASLVREWAKDKTRYRGDYSL